MTGERDRGLARFLRDPLRLPHSLERAARALLQGGPHGLAVWLHRGENLGEALPYPAWIARHDPLSAVMRAELQTRAAKLQDAEPLSLAPELITDVESLQRALGAARMQLHSRWELLLASPRDAAPALRRLLDEAAAVDARVRLLGPFPDRAGAWSAAIESARGSHLALLPREATLREHSLLLYAEALAEDPSLDLLYADHDRLSPAGARHSPFFKPQFHPELLWSLDLFGPFALLRTGLARSLQLRPSFAPAERFDLLLRASRRARIARLPFILSHQRDEPGGDAPGTAAPGQKPGAAEDATPADAPARVAAAGRRSLEDELQRKLPGARVFAGPTAETRRIALPPPAPRPLISAIICTRDGVKVLRRCVEGVLERTDWKALELVVVDNGSRDPETLAFLDELRQSGRGRVLRDESPFNFSALNNRAARVARGELLAFLNDDLEILDPQWLTELAVHALRPGIGAVGARLLYPDGRVQHAGVATGVLGLAGHLLRGVARDDPGPNGFARVLRGSTVVTAACMVLRRELFLECGGFDEEHLAVAFNDVDLCLRLAGRGHRNLYVPTAELVHHESWSRGSDLTPARRERFARELQTMLLRWPALDRDPLYSPNLSLATEQLEPGSPPRLPGRLAGALQTTEHPGGELW